MAKLNLYVPDDLKSRMDRVDGVVWSQVACEAFQTKLGQLAAQKQEKVMQDVIERLRASKIKDDSDLKAAGRAEGESWAKHRAAAGELRRLEKFVEDLRSAPNEPFDYEGMHQPPSAACEFVYVIRPDEHPNSDAPAEFWLRDEDLPGFPEDQFVQGFADGALKIWYQVCREL